MKKILGLDLGTNSIGWALVEIDHENGTVRIIGLGSRILPMDAGEIADFESKGKIKSTAAQRTEKRGPRRLNERYLLRRDRLHLILNLLEALPEHYKIEIDFTNNKGEKCGQFKGNKEPKLAYLPKNNVKKAKFLFMESYLEMLKDIDAEGIKNEKSHRIPYDWTLYYLRQKALKQKISLEELAWVLLSYNQKRGYEKTESVDDYDDLSEKLDEFGLTKSIQEEIDTSKIEIDSFVPKVLEANQMKNKFGVYYEILLDNGFSYKEYSTKRITEINENIDELKIIERITFLNEEGSGIDDLKTIYKVDDSFLLKIRNIIPKETKGKFLKEYENGWQTETNLNDYTRFKRSKDEIEEEVFVTRLYNSNGDLIKPSKKLGELHLNISKDPYLEFKLLDPTKESNWKILKKKTEKEALKFNSLYELKDKKGNIQKFISPKIYNTLKNDAKSGNRTKIIGGKFQVVDREFYREELKQIIATQKKFHQSLEDEKIFQQCVRTLYPNHKTHQEFLLKNRDAIQHLLIEDILLYQRPLKSKKTEIADCKYEIRYWKDILNKETKQPIEEVDEETGEVKIKQEPIYHKVVSASHPYFQEFRIWDKLHNLKLIQLERETDGKLRTNVDVTSEYFSNEIYDQIFEKINNRKTYTQKNLIEFLKPQFKLKMEDAKNFVWNFPEDEELKGNETRVSFAIRFKRCGFTDYNEFLTQEKELDLWHFLYSVSYKERVAKDKNGIENKSVATFFNRFLEGSTATEDVKGKLIRDFANYPKFTSKYCAYSEKALKKMIPFMRLGERRFVGKFDISENISDLKSIEFDKNRIAELIKKSKFNGKELEHYKQGLFESLWKHSINERVEEIIEKIKEIDFSAEKINFSKVVESNAENGKLSFPKGLFNAFKGFENTNDFTSLDLTKTSYLVYGRHSELAQAKYWKSPDDIRKQLHQELKQHSLNNPIAEKVLLEMMQIVADIWENKEFGDNQPDYFSRIHLEVGRELKKSAKEKESETIRMSANRAQNKRLRQVLKEFLSVNPYNANPKNSDHFDRLKIVEDGAEHKKNTDKDFFNDKQYSKKEIEDILKKPNISKTDFDKYKLWIEQGYRSPYTGEIIKLSHLFDGNKYNIDHVFPQASITNDSLSNKVVCEREVNKIKSDQTGRDFVNNPKQRKIYCAAHNADIEIVGDDKYVSIVKAQFSGTKRYIMLSKEIPKGFTSSQLNNTRHIARKAMELLSHIVREPDEVEFRSKNVLPVTGAVTSKLKEAWRLDEVWKELVAPRFIRLNKLIQPNLFSIVREEDMSYLYGRWQTSQSGHEYFDCNLDDSIREKDESYNIKRIDHRHHALDALIVALCTEEHVNYFSNINANAKSENYGKQKQIENYRKTLKRKIMFSVSKPTKDDPNNKSWYLMRPGEIRNAVADNSVVDSVLKKSYIYKNFDTFNDDYRKMILTALKNTMVTFKQNLRVINKTVNKYNNTPDKNKFEKQVGAKGGNKDNWAIRRSLGKGTYYGKIDIGERVNKMLHSNADYFYENIDSIVDNEIRNQLELIKLKSASKMDFETKLIANFSNIKVKCIAFKAASRYNNNLDKSFNNKEILKITDRGIQKVLINHLKKFDTVELPFEEALKYYDAVLEKQELEAIINSEDNAFDTIQDLNNYLKLQNFIYKKSDYSKLNVFTEKVATVDFRNNEQLKDKIIEHPEIAFTKEEIEEMNKPENIRKLNINKKGEERDHKPILKMRTYTGFGHEKQVSDNCLSVKSKQFVKVDKGTNYYISFYELEDLSKLSSNNPKRIFREINLFDLIEYQKFTETFEIPIEEIIYKNGEKYKFLFVLTQNDIVKVTTKNNDIEEDLIFAFNRFSVNAIYFRPINHAYEIEKCEVDLKTDSITGKLVGSQENETTSINGVQIKDICIKLKVDRLGNIISIDK